MAVTYATVTSVGAGPGPRLKYEFYPETTNNTVTVAADNYTHVGPYAAVTNAQGGFTIALPSNTDQGGGTLVWRVVETPLTQIPNRGLNARTIGYFTIPASIDYDDLIASAIAPTVVTPTIVENVGNYATAAQNSADAAAASAASVNREQANGVAGLDGSGKLYSTRIPDLAATYVSRSGRTQHAPALGLYFPEAEGATADGVADDTTAITAALTAAGSTGRVILSAGVTYRVATGLTIGLRQHLEVQTGATLTRLATDTNTGPVVLLNRNHGRLTGLGTVQSLNGCPNGVVRVERTDGTAEWAKILTVQIKGPGSGVAGSTGLVFAGNSTFQNLAHGVTISDVATGHRSDTSANANHLADVVMYNIGSIAYDFNGTIETTVTGGSVLSSASITVFNFSNSAQGNVISGVSAEPGGTATGYVIASGCLDNFIGPCFLNVTNRGTDNGTRTTIISRRHAKIGDEFYLENVRQWPQVTVKKPSNETVNNSTTFQDDDHLTSAVVASSEYRFEFFVRYTSDAAADLKLGLTVPTGATATWTAVGASSGATSTGSGNWNERNETQAVVVGGDSVNVQVARVVGFLTVSTTAGALTLRWAQSAATVSDTSVLARSRLLLQRVA